MVRIHKSGKESQNEIIKFYNFIHQVFQNLEIFLKTRVISIKSHKVPKLSSKQSNSKITSKIKYKNIHFQIFEIHFSIFTYNCL